MPVVDVGVARRGGRIATDGDAGRRATRVVGEAGQHRARAIRLVGQVAQLVDVAKDMESSRTAGRTR